MELFGFEIAKKKKSSAKNDSNKKDLVSFVAPHEEEGIDRVVAAPGGYYGQYLDIDGSNIANDRDLIYKYREISQQPECDAAIEDIINAAITGDGYSSLVNINLDRVEQSEKIKKIIREEFENILSLLDFNFRGHDIFRKWYVDGRLYYHKIIDKTAPKKGIQELRMIDPTRIRKIREIIEEIDPKTKVKFVKSSNEYFVYQNADYTSVNTYTVQSSTGLRINPDAITYVTSGIVDPSQKRVLSYLHKAIKPVNQLRMMEDALVIYRISRAPERRVFYIDVGNLPKGKAEEYMRTIIAKHRNKVVYNSSTGEIVDDRRHMSMLEDFFLPRRDGSRGTEIDTLPAGCLAMNTSVALIDGRNLTISEIAEEMSKSQKELWTYSINPENGIIVPGLISWAGVTQKSAEVLRLTINNKDEIICTPDHKFPICDKGFVRADELVINERMMPFYQELFITNIEKLSEKIEVGTLTIDKEEKYHDYHTFMLSCGIFTKNSNLSEIDDIIYFQKRLYRSLNVPTTRLETETMFSVGRTTEISRDELKFHKFVEKLKKRFSLGLFGDLLRTQLLLKGIIDENDWDEFSQDIYFHFDTDNHFYELKEIEILRERLQMLMDVDAHAGKYFSVEWIKKNVLKQTDEEIKTIADQIAKEPKEDDGMGGGMDAVMGGIEEPPPEGEEATGGEEEELPPGEEELPPEEEEEEIPTEKKKKKS